MILCPIPFFSQRRQVTVTCGTSALSVAAVVTSSDKITTTQAPVSGGSPTLAPVGDAGTPAARSEKKKMPSCTCGRSQNRVDCFPPQTEGARNALPLTHPPPPSPAPPSPRKSHPRKTRPNRDPSLPPHTSLVSIKRPSPNDL